MNKIFTFLPSIRSIIFPKLIVRFETTLKITANEQKLIDILKEGFPNASEIEVKDISGGCGAMYEVYVVSRDFSGLNLVKQHQLVNSVLKKEIKDMHGIRIQTKLPAHWNANESQYK